MQTGRYWVFFADRGSDVAARLEEAEEFIALGPSAARRESARCLAADQYDLLPWAPYVERVESLAGSEAVVQSRYLNAVTIELTDAQVQELLSTDIVSEVRPVCASTFSPPEETPAADSYGLSLSQLEQTGITDLHQRGWTGSGVTVGILDTGFELDHPALQSVNVLAEWDFINDDSVVAWEEGDDPDQPSHGTRVLSVMAGYDSGFYVGGAFGASFVLGKTEDIGDESQVEEDYWVAGLEWLDSQGVQLLNSSLGYIDWYEPWQMDGNTAVTTVAADLAASKGLMVYNAAGNEGPGDTTLIAPSDGDSVFSSGAVDGSGLIADFSSRGPTADGRIKPDGCSRGQMTVAVSWPGTGYSTVNGTSFASPLTASAAACVASAHPEWSMMRVYDALRETADRSDSPDNEYGNGVINAWSAVLHRSVAGRVRRSDTGEPLENITVVVTMESGTSVSVTTNSQGCFAVEPGELGNFTAVSSGWGEAVPVSGTLDENGSEIFIFADPVNSSQPPSVYPNPSSWEFYIGFDVVQESADVTLTIFTVTGDKVFTEERPSLPAGCYRAPVAGEAFYWNGTSSSGDTMASGQYIALLRTGDSVELLNLALIRGAEENL